LIKAVTAFFASKLGNIVYQVLEGWQFLINDPNRLSGGGSVIYSQPAHECISR